MHNMYKRKSWHQHKSTPDLRLGTQSTLHEFLGGKQEVEWSSFMNIKQGIIEDEALGPHCFDLGNIIRLWIRSTKDHHQRSANCGWQRSLRPSRLAEQIRTADIRKLQVDLKTPDQKLALDPNAMWIIYPFLMETRGTNHVGRMTKASPFLFFHSRVQLMRTIYDYSRSSRKLLLGSCGKEQVPN